MRAAIVQFYCTCSLYYLVLRVSYNLCAVYLYYFATPTQILRALAAPAQLVPATTYHHPPPLKSQWWCSCSGANGGAPVQAGANVGPSIPPPSHQSPIQSIRPISLIQPVISQSILYALVQVRQPLVVSAGASILTKHTRRIPRRSAPTSTQSLLQPYHLPH